MSKGSRPKIKYCSFPLPRPVRKKHCNPKKKLAVAVPNFIGFWRDPCDVGVQEHFKSRHVCNEASI